MFTYSERHGNFYAVFVCCRFRKKKKGLSFVEISSSVLGMNSL